MSSTRPPHRYITARERVARRRTSNTTRRMRPDQRGGCGTVVLSILIIGIIATIAVTLIVRRVSQALDAIEQDDPRQAAGLAGADGAPGPVATEKLREPFNVLLIGVDKRDNPDDGVRSDTLIVVHVNPVERWAGMLSIPRDSVVQIPRLGQQKINTAYTYGYMHAGEFYEDDTPPATAGAALAAESVEGFLGLKIDYIAQVDFQGFERIVDALNGIVIDVPRPLLDPEYPTEDFGYERIYIPPGLQVLEGELALKYARSRHSDSDFDRSRRQQQVLNAILTNVRQRGLLDQAALMPDMFSELEQTVSTSLPISDPVVLRDLVRLAQELPLDRIITMGISPDEVRVVSEDGSDIYWDQNDIDTLVVRLMAGPAATSEVARIQVQNGAGIQGLATRVTTTLSGQGFFMNDAGDASDIYEHTTIIDYTNQPQTRQRLADLLGVDPVYIQVDPDADAPPAPYSTDILVVLGEDYQDDWMRGE